MTHILALDQGTSSSRAIVFSARGEIVAAASREFAQHFPRPGEVEHDPVEIWQSTLAVARQALRESGLPVSSMAAVGITNQRETTVLWERASGHPLGNAIVWQDRRTEPACRGLREAGHEALVRRRTGLVIDPYFSATKLAWMLDHLPGARARAARGELAFGTIDSWLLWNLTGGAVHATDVTNASRTMLFDIVRGEWDDELLALFDLPRALLPQVLPSSTEFGRTAAALFGTSLPICGVAGDQQAALFGQACFEAGLAKNTYGTGCFLLRHVGAQASEAPRGCLTTPAAWLPGQRAYAFEGSVFIGGAVVQWLRDGLGLIRSSGEIEALAASVPDSAGVSVVPAFAGLGAPYWNPAVRGAILGLSRGSTRAHVARAALESIAFQSAELLLTMEAGAATPIAELRVDGGAAVNDLLMQFQADLLGIPVVRPRVTETTALGAAYLAGLQAGVFADCTEIAALWAVDRRFEPRLGRAAAEARMAEWRHAVAQASLGC
ncbi:MAG: glycerol kinase GlpK [Rhodocyclaceae bacterium]|nr:glycerol kinase GlpK [Rhodocyclaceae bacterium]